MILTATWLWAVNVITFGNSCVLFHHHISLTAEIIDHALLLLFPLNCSQLASILFTLLFSYTSSVFQGWKITIVHSNKFYNCTKKTKLSDFTVWIILGHRCWCFGKNSPCANVFVYNKMFLATKKSGKVLRIYFVRRAILIIFLDYIICSIENSGTFIIVAAVTVNCMHFKT